MSDEIATEPLEGSPSTSLPPSSSPDARPGRLRRSWGAVRRFGQRHKWLRRLFWLAIVLVVVVRIAIPLLLPWVLDFVASGYGLRVQYERLDLSVLSGDFELWNFTVEPEGGGERYLDLEYCRGDLAVSRLFLGEIVVRRAEIDGLDLLVERASDGRLVILDHFPPSDSVEEEVEEPEEEDDSEPIRLQSPIRVDAARLQHLRLTFRDASVSPPTEIQLLANMGISGLGDPDREARIHLLASSPQMLDSFQVTGELRTAEDHLEARFESRLRSLRLQPLAGLLEPLGIRPTDQALHAEGSLDLRARTTGANGQTIELELDTGQLEARADAETWASLDRLGLRARVRDRDVHVLLLEIVDGLVRARRTPDGLLHVATVDFASPQTPGGSIEAAPEPDTSLAVVPPTTKSESEAPLRSVRIDELTLRNLTAEWVDGSVEGLEPLRATLDLLEIREAVLDPAHPDDSVRLVASMTIPGVVTAARAEIEGLPFAEERSLRAHLQASGIRPDALRPYLDAAGIESLWQDGQAEMTLTASMPKGTESLRVSMTDLILSDEEELLGVSEAGIRGARLTDDGIAIDEIVARGFRSQARRSSSGDLVALGFRFKPQAATDAVEEAFAESLLAPELAEGPRDLRLYDTRALAGLASSLAFQLPLRVEIGRIAVDENRLLFVDELLTEPMTFDLASMGLEVSGLGLGGSSNQQTVPGELRAWLTATPVLGRLEVEGSLTTGPRDLGLEARVTMSGLDVVSLDAYLASSGLKGHMTDGSAEAQLTAAWHLDSEGEVHLDASLKEARLSEGEREWLGVDAVTLSEVTVGPKALDVAAVDVLRPRLRAERWIDGTVLVLGVQVPPTPIAEEQVAQATPTESESPMEEAPVSAVPIPVEEVTGGSGEEAPSKVPGEAAAKSASQDLPKDEAPDKAPHEPVVDAPDYPIRLARLSMVEGRLVLMDELAPSEGELVIQTDARLSDLELGGDGRPAPIEMSGSVAGVMESYSVMGSLTPGTERIEVQLTSSAMGVRGERLEPFLPPGIDVMLVDGRMSASLEARIEAHTRGGMRFDAAIREVVLKEGEGEALLSVEAIQGGVDRFDSAGGVIAIDELVVLGVETRVERNAAGQIFALGLRVDPEAASAMTVEPVLETEPVEDLEADEDRGPVRRPRTAADRRAARRRLIARMFQQIPRVTLDRLELDLRRLTFLDRSVEGAETVEVQSLRLTNVERIRLLGEDPEDEPPIALQVTGRITPLLEELDVGMQLSPFADEPTFAMDVKGRGVNGSAIGRCFPQLAELVDGTALDDGQFEGHVEAILEVYRENPVTIAWRRGISGEIQARDVAFRNGAEGPVLAGFRGLRVEIERILPDEGLIHIRSVELDKPLGRIVREADGIRVLDVLVKVPMAPAAEEVAGEPAAPVDPEQVEAPEAEGAPTPSVDSKAQVRVDSFFVTGIDFTVFDRSAEPEMVLPLQGLDVEVRGLTSRLLEQRTPVRFGIFAQGGLIELPNVEGQRPAFGDFELQGALSFEPLPSGWAKIGMSGIELANFQGPASQTGVELEGGVFDGRIDVRFEPDGTLNTESLFIFTDLDLSEESGGPIERFLKLPAPLDAVLFVLRDEGGEIDIPLSFDVSPEGLSLGRITQVAITTLGTLIVDAIANSPFRVIGTVGALNPFGGGEEEAAPEEILTLEFRPGTRELSEEARKLVNQLRARLEEEPLLQITLRHELGTLDLQHASRVANPTPEQTRALISEMRRRIDTLETKRGLIATELSAALSMGARVAAGELRAQLVSLEAERGRVESALDDVLALLRSGSDRLRERRMRTAALVLASQRLILVQDMLLVRQPDVSESRVRTGRPGFEREPETESGHITVEVTHVRR